MCPPHGIGWVYQYLPRHWLLLTILCVLFYCVFVLFSCFKKYRVKCRVKNSAIGIKLGNRHKTWQLSLYLALYSAFVLSARKMPRYNGHSAKSWSFLVYPHLQGTRVQTMKSTSSFKGSNTNMRKASKRVMWWDNPVTSTKSTCPCHWLCLFFFLLWMTSNFWRVSMYLCFSKSC